MDPQLKALCQELWGGDVNSEKFGWLLIETGVNVEGLEWDVATRLIEWREAQSSLAKKYVTIIQ